MMVTTVLLLLAVVLGACYRHWFIAPYRGKQAVVIHLYEGETTAAELLSQLQKKSPITHNPLFAYFLSQSLPDGTIRVGEYRLDPGMNLQTLLQQIKNRQPVAMHFALIRGWSAEHMLKRMHILSSFRPADLSPEGIRQALHIPQSSLEGLFYPATYPYHWGDSPLQVLRYSYRKMQALLQKEWQNRDQNLPYASPYQALIVASLIEKESYAENERPLIAQVILNRLHKGMLLQIDPTVLYAWREQKPRRLTYKMLEINSPYNTYRYKGLPPTPICMPSAASIHAALHPAGSKALFYVAKGDGVHHRFSSNYRSHLRYVEAYRHELRQQNSDVLLNFPLSLRQLQKYWHSNCRQVHYWLLFLASAGNLAEQDRGWLFPVSGPRKCHFGKS